MRGEEGEGRTGELRERDRPLGGELANGDPAVRGPARERRGGGGGGGGGEGGKKIHDRHEIPRRVQCYTHRKGDHLTKRSSSEALGHLLFPNICGWKDNIIYII